MVSTGARRMPKIRREKLPDHLLIHLLTRVRERSISHEQLVALARWMDTEPEVQQADGLRDSRALLFSERASSLSRS